MAKTAMQTKMGLEGERSYFYIAKKLDFLSLSKSATFPTCKWRWNWAETTTWRWAGGWRFRPLWLPWSFSRRELPRRTISTLSSLWNKSQLNHFARHWSFSFLTLEDFVHEFNPEILVFELGLLVAFGISGSQHVDRQKETQNGGAGQRGRTDLLRAKFNALTKT